jgi:hypothetical protein
MPDSDDTDIKVIRVIQQGIPNNGGGGGLTVWDSGATYQTGEIKLWHDGLWESQVDNNHGSEPVAGNADWELVGGTPYVDVGPFDPPGIISAPFYDRNLTGPGVLAVPAPGTNKWVYSPLVTTEVSAGDDWNSHANPILTYGNTAGIDSFGGQTIDDGLDGKYNGAPFASLPNITTPTRAYSGDVINLPLVLSQSALSSAGGTRSIKYRVYYLILEAGSDFPATQFFIIASINQGAKTIEVVDLNGDASALTGSIAIVGSTANNGTYTVVATAYEPVTRNITAVDQILKTFTVAGDHALQFSPGLTVLVSGSTGNDGVYTVVSVVFATGNTTITVVEVIPDSTPDGTIAGINLVTIIAVAEAIPDPTADGWVKQ